MLTNTNNVNSESEINVHVVDNNELTFGNVVTGVIDTIKTMFEPDERMTDYDSDSDSKNILAGVMPTMIDEPIIDAKGLNINMDPVDLISNDINPGIDNIQMPEPIPDAQVQPGPVHFLKGGNVSVVQALKGSMDDPNSLYYKYKYEMYKKIYYALKDSIN